MMNVSNVQTASVLCSSFSTISMLFFHPNTHTHVHTRRLPASGSGQFDSMPRQGSELFLECELSPPCQRMGAMVAFRCFDDFRR